MPPSTSPSFARGLLAVLMDMRPALLRYLGLRGAAPDEAEDILQNMALKIADAALGPVDQPKAYLYRMATSSPSSSA